jgi:Pro-kumamolisin, activation domain/Bacterial Ig-like domain (group 3)
MKLQSWKLRISLFVFALILALTAFRSAAQTKPNSATAAPSSTVSAAVPSRITQAINEKQLVRFKGNIHPLARPQFDQGAVPDSMPAKRMLLFLKPSMDQESALTQFLIDQQNAASPNYHKWLTPEQFGAKFGPADADIQTVVTWLESQGFQVAKVSKGKIAIEFSGTAAQLRQAFHTEIHKYLVNGEMHFANATVPQIPAALAPVVRGVAPLNNFRPKPTHHVAGEFTKSIGSSQVKSLKPDFSTSGGSFAIGPTDFAKIYNVLPLWNAATPIDGTGQSIAIIGVSNINLQDVKDFRTIFGLPTAGAANTPVVVIDGDDPGIINDGSETEALLDVELAGAVAKNAQIHLIIAADADLGLGSGLLLAIFHALDFNADPIMSLSFSDCESDPTIYTGYPILWQQAAAQGITVTVATGDNGSAGCEDPNALAPTPATTGLQVNGLASTPFNVAVGGTDFNDVGTEGTYFSATNDPTTLVSAKGYIPESTWNNSCTNLLFGAGAEANCNTVANQSAVVTVGASGGASTVNAKPPYQSFVSAANGMPADGARDLPDVSLFASDGKDGFHKSFYAMCEADAVTAPSCTGTTFSFLGAGGTSGSTPNFAGIMALVNQKTGQRQGNANFPLYRLAQMQYTAATACDSVASPLPAAACTFNDVTTGTIAMPCTTGSVNCNTTVGTDTIGVLSGYDTGAGYDLATGLGSVNAANLVNNWSIAVNSFTSTTTTLTLTPQTGINAGQDVTVNATVTPGSGSATPTGILQLVSDSPAGGGFLDGYTLDVNGQVVAQPTSSLTGGTYHVTARYVGDETFAPSVSAPVTVTIGKTDSTTAACVEISFGLNGACNPFTTGQAPVTLFLQSTMGPATINPNGNTTPTGTVTFMDTFNGSTTAVASNIPISSQTEAFTLPGISTFGSGTHSIVANYSGDASYNPSSSAPVVFTLTNSVPTITAPLVPSSATAGGPQFTLTVNGTNFVANSTVNFGGAAKATTFVSAARLTATILATDIATPAVVPVTVTNPAPGGGTSNTVNFNVTSFTLTASNVTVTTTPSAAGTVATGTSTITLTPIDGFAGAVTVSCPAAASLPPGMTCTPVTIPAGSTTGTLTINLTDPSSSLSAMVTPKAENLSASNLPANHGDAKAWMALSGGSGFAALLLFFLPGRKRLRAALGIGLVCVLSFALGCGSHKKTVVPVATTTKVSVVSTKAASGSNIAFTVAVTSSATPTGQVQLLDGTAPLGSPVALAGGSATIMNSALAVGTHSISAHYAGDAKTLASSSGAISVTVTGTAPSVTITAASGSITATTTMTISVN